MALFSLQRQLLALECAPDDSALVEPLKSHVRQVRGGGERLMRLLEAARAKHVQRAQFSAAAILIEIEAGLSKGDEDFVRALLKEQARIYAEEVFDFGAALAAYDRLCEGAPKKDSLSKQRARLAADLENMSQAVERDLEQGRATGDIQALLRAACLCWRANKPEVQAQADDIFAEALREGRGQARVAHVYALALGQQNKADDAVDVLRNAARQVSERRDRIGLFLHAAFAARDLLQDEEQAHGLFQDVQRLEPNNWPATDWIGRYLSKDGDLKAARAHYERALRTQKEVAVQGEILAAYGELLERNQLREESADVFARLRKLDPAHPKALLVARSMAGSEPAQLRQALEEALGFADDPETKKSLALELARIAEQQGDQERSIRAWQEVLRIHPAHNDAQAALNRLLKESGHWNAVVDRIRDRLSDMPAAPTHERVQTWLELARVYRDELKLPALAGEAYEEVLKLDPAQREALETVQELYRESGRWNDLINVLQRQAAALNEPAQKIRLYEQIAGIWEKQFSDSVNLAKALEQIVEIDPQRAQTRKRLKEIYAQRRDWQGLHRILTQQLQTESDANEKRAAQEALAELCTDHLKKYDEAIGLWRALAEDKKSGPRALEALEKLATQKQDWQLLIGALERRVELSRDKKEKRALLERLAVLYKEKAGAAAEGLVPVWTRLLELDPKHRSAKRELLAHYTKARAWDAVERLFAQQSDWSGLVDALHVAADRAEHGADKVELLSREAKIVAEHLQGDVRVRRCYEAIALLDPSNVAAAQFLAPLYEKESNWLRYELALKALSEEADREKDLRAARQVWAKQRDLYAGPLRDVSQAYAYAAKIFAVEPNDAANRRVLDSIVEQSAAYGEYAALLQDALNKSQLQSELRLELRRKLATVAGEQLGDKALAAKQLEAIAEETPLSSDESRRLSRYYEELGDADQLARLLRMRVQSEPDEKSKKRLALRLASLHETQSDKTGEAFETYWNAHRHEPQRIDYLQGVARTAPGAGRWQELEGALILLAERISDVHEKGQYLVQLGDVRRTQLKNSQGALSAYQAAVAEGCSDASLVKGLQALMNVAQCRRPALTALAQLHASQGDVEAFSELFDREIPQAKDPGTRRSLWLERAQTLEQKFSDQDAAFAALQQAFLEDVADAELLDEFIQAAARLDRQEDAASALRKVLKSGKLDRNLELGLALRLAQLYDEELGDMDQAHRLYARALELDPLNGPAFEALKRHYTQTESWAKIDALYSERIEHTASQSDRKELLLQHAFLQEDLTGDLKAAAKTYQTIVDLEPGQPQASRALRALYRKLGDWSGLAQLLEKLLTVAPDEEQRTLHAELADLYVRELGNAVEGVRHYQKLLARNSQYPAALQGLEALLEDPKQGLASAHVLAAVYRKDGASKSLARVLEVIAQRTEDEAERVAACLELADLYQTQLHDSGRAFDKVALALSLRPTDETLYDRLAALAERTQRVEELISVLNAVGSTLDSDQQLAVLWRIAAVQEKSDPTSQQLEDTLRRLIALSEAGASDWQKANAALADYFRRTKRSKELARVLETQLAYSEQPLDMYRQLADLYERDLQRSDKAIEALSRWREADPADRNVFVRLRALVEQSQDWERLAALLLDEAHRLGADIQASELRMMAAQIFEQRMSDSHAALEIWRKVHADLGLSAPVAQALIDLNRRAGNWDELSRVLLSWAEQVSDVRERIALRKEAAAIQSEHLNDDEIALQLWTQVIADEPLHPEAREALCAYALGKDPERALLAARAVAPALIETKDWKRAVKALDVVGASTDTAERIAAKRRNAQIRANHLQQFDKALELAQSALSDALAAGNYAELVEEFEHVARKAGKLSRFVGEVQALAAQSDSPEIRVALHRRAAWVAQQESGNDALARVGYAAILQDEPNDRDALEALIDLERRGGKADALVAALERKVSLIPDPAARGPVLFEIGQLKESKLNDVFGAVDAYEQMLAIALDALALQELARLYRAQESWENLASVYERQIQFLRPKPVEIVFELADLYNRQIDDPQRAVDALAYVASEPSVEDRLAKQLRGMLGDERVAARAAEVLDPIVTRRGKWAEAIELLRLRLRFAKVLDDKMALLRRIAEIHEHKLAQRQEAAAAYGEAFLLDPRSEADARRFADLSAAAGEWDRLAAHFDRALNEIEIDDQDTIRIAREAAALFEERLNNLERAAASYERVHRFDPGDEAVADRLQSLYERLGKWTELAALCRERLNFADSQEKQIALLCRLAEISEKRFEQNDDAIAVCREILQLDIDNGFANQSLLRLLQLEARWDELSQLLSARLDRTAPGPLWNELACQLARVSDEHLHDRPRAVELFGKVLQNQPQHDEARAALETLIVDENHTLAVARILEPIYESQRDWKKQADVIAAQVEHLQDVDEKTRRLRDLAQLCELKLRDQYAAFAAWGKALALSPEDTEVQQHVDRLAEVLLEWQAWVQMYESAVINCQSATRRASLILDVARTQDKQLGDPRTAIKSYRRALDEDPWLDQAHAELDALLTLVGDWQELVDVLEHQLDFKNDSKSRLQLLQRIGSTHEDFLGNAEQAIHAYERALIEDNQDRTTLQALDRLYTAHNDESKLVDVLHRLLSLAEGADKQDYAVRLAALHESLGENEQAIEVLQLHVPDPTRYPRAARVLSVLLEREGRWDDLQQHLQQSVVNLQDASVKSDALGRLGLLYEQRHRDEAQARICFEQALAEDPHNNLALDGLLRLARGDARVSSGQSMIESLLAQQGRTDELVAIKSLHLAQTQDPQARLALQEDLATLEEQRGSLNAALDLRLDLFDFNAEDLGNRARIEHLARATGRVPSYLARMQQAAETCGDARIAADLFRSIAELSLQDMQDVERAIHGYSRSLAADFNQPAVLDALDKLLLQEERWTELEQLFERRIEANAHASEVLDLETRLAALRWHQLGDEAGALRALERVLRRVPQHQPAVEILDHVMQGAEFSDPSLRLLEEIVPVSNDWLRLARAYEERAARETTGNRAAWLTKAADIYEKKQERAAAFTMRLRAFEDDPALTGVFAALCAEARSDEQRAALLQVVEHIDNSPALSPEQRITLWLDAAQWCQTHVGARGLDMTRRYLEKVVALDPESENANHDLLAIHKERGDIDAAVRLLWRWADSTTDVSKRIELWNQAAELSAADNKWLSLAADSYQRIVSLDPTRTIAVQALLAIRRKEERWSDVAQLLELLAESTSNQELRIASWTELASLFRGKLRNPERAMQCLEQLRALQSDSDHVVLDLADMYQELGRYEDLVALLEQQVTRATSDDSKVALHLHLAEVLNRKLKHSAKALVHYRAVLAIRNSHPTALEAVEKALSAERRWEELTEFLMEQANQAETQGRTDQAISFLDRAAMIYKEKRKDRRAAMRVFQRVMDLDPKQELALRHAAQLAEDLGETEVVVSALERLIPLVPASEAVALAKRIAALGDATKAEHALQVAWQTSGGAVEASQALREHYSATQQFESLAQLLEDSLRSGAASSDPADWIELATLYRDKLNQKQNAIRCFEQARAARPHDMQVMESLADLYSTEGVDGQALPVLEAIVAGFNGKRTKKLVPYLQRLACALRDKGRAAEAVGLLERAAKLDANNVIVLRDLGLTCYAQQEWEKAQRALRSLLLQRIGADDGVSKADVYFYLGDIAARLGDRERAETMLERSLSEQADHAQARARLAELRR